MFDKLTTGMEVYEDRHCGRAAPGIGNEALPLVGDVVVPTPTPPPLPVPLPVPTPTPPALSTAQLQALIPNELLDRINKFAFNETPFGQAIPAPACKKQAPFDYAGERTQYPHVTAGAGR
jgi:hypothetical protein